MGVWCKMKNDNLLKIVGINVYRNNRSIEAMTNAWS